MLTRCLLSNHKFGRLSVKANKSEWHIIATTILSLECECKKEFQVTATSLKKAVAKAEKILGAEDLEWKIRAAWWLDRPGKVAAGRGGVMEIGREAFKEYRETFKALAGQGTK